MGHTNEGKRCVIFVLQYCLNVLVIQELVILWAPCGLQVVRIDCSVSWLDVV